MEPLLVEFAIIRAVLYYGAVYGVVIGMAVWIYRDARSRGSRAPLGWALATLVLTIVPVLGYLYLRWRAEPIGADTVEKSK